MAVAIAPRLRVCRRRASVSVKEEFGSDTTEWVMSVPCGVANTAVWMEGERACDNRSWSGLVCSITKGSRPVSVTTLAILSPIGRCPRSLRPAENEIAWHGLSFHPLPLSQNPFSFITALGLTPPGSLSPLLCLLRATFTAYRIYNHIGIIHSICLDSIRHLSTAYLANLSRQSYHTPCSGKATVAIRPSIHATFPQTLPKRHVRSPYYTPLQSVHPLTHHDDCIGKADGGHTHKVSVLCIDRHS